MFLEGLSFCQLSYDIFRPVQKSIQLKNGLIEKNRVIKKCLSKFKLDFIFIKRKLYISKEIKLNF